MKNPMSSAIRPAQKDSQRPRKRGSRAKRWLLAGGAVALGVVVFGFGGQRLYQRLRKERLVGKAREFYQQRHYNAAGIAVRRALQVDPQNVEATRLMVELAETMQSREAISWRRRLIELEPANFDHRLALAEFALRFGDTASAGAALAAPPAAAENNASFHDLAGRVAVAAKDSAKAEGHFARAVRLAPENGLYSLHLASVRLRSKKLEVRMEAREELEKLRKKPELRHESLRLLVEEALAHGDWSRARLLAQELQSGSDATFDDRLLHLDALRRLRHSDFASSLTKLQDEAATNARDVYAVVAWMNANGLARAAIEWTGRLPAEIVSAMPVPMALANSYASLGDWRGLKPLVDDRAENEEAKAEKPAPKERPAGQSAEAAANWANAEFMRLALLSRVLREGGQTQESLNRWNDAVKAAANRPEALKVLARAASEWKWDSQSADVLWMIAADAKEGYWALGILHGKYSAAGSTRNLVRVASRMLEINPSDPFALNNMAALSLLLNANMDQAIKMARDSYQKDPTNPVYASTYAYALHVQGRTAEGIDIMRSVVAGQLEQPAYAAYFGVLLGAVDSREEARKYLALGQNASLLPEERHLVEEAAAKVGLPLPKKTSASGK